ncbi:MAG: formyltransferase family protein, partial [Armatimonadota bacterium]|nr:formyltransferase family protein [Armatimonadota bacterium]
MASERRKTRLAVLVSGRGRGTTLQAFLDASASGSLPAEVVVVVSTTPGTPALERARLAGVPALVLPPDEALDERLVETLRPYAPDLVCLAGFLRKLGPAMLSAYRWRIMNSHPALIP